MFIKKLDILKEFKYMDSYVIILSINLMIIAMILMLIALFIRRDIKRTYMRLPHNSDDLEFHDEKKLRFQDSNIILSKNSMKCYYLSKISSFLIFMSIMIITIIPSLFSGVDRMNIISACLLSIFMYICYLLDYIGHKYAKISEEKHHTIKKGIKNLKRKFYMELDLNKLGFFLKLITLISLAVFIPFSLQGICVAPFSDKFGFYWLEVRRVSTSFTRYFEIEKVCPPGPPCHIYASLPENTSDSVFINLHTSTQTKQVKIVYQVEDDAIEERMKGKLKPKHEVMAQMFPMQNVDELGKRNVHSALIKGLQPSTRYVMTVMYSGEKDHKGEFIYKTLPERDGKVIVAMGGDVGSNYTVGEMNNQVERHEPDVMIIGGDAAYDEGIGHCYYAWDLFLWYFEKVDDALGRVVPMIISTGNHDIGYNALAIADKPIPLKDLPPLFMFFPQHLNENQELPQLDERRLYFHHFVGNSIQFTLDTGYVSSFEGEQLSWFKKTLRKYPEYPKFANYHVPIYGSCFKENIDDKRPIDLAKKYWVPLFEQHKFMAAFENHVHFYKKTKPLIQDKVDPQGVMYLGDGTWGVIPNKCPEEHVKKLLESNKYDKIASLNHVWILTIDEKRVLYKPIGIDGQPIEDQFHQVLRTSENN